MMLITMIKRLIHRRRKWSRRPVVALILVSIALGAVVNSAVAWGIALKHSYDGNQRPSYAKDRSLVLRTTWPAGVPKDWSSDCWLSSVSSESGLTYFVYKRYPDLHIRNPDQSVLSYRVVNSWRFGLPMRSLEYTRYREEQQASPNSGVWGSIDITVSARKLGYGGSDSLYLPVQPRPLGFVVNTLAYALGICLFSAGVIALRVRYRRGDSLCIHCGYDVTGASRCPECGVVISDLESGV